MKRTVTFLLCLLSLLLEFSPDAGAQTRRRSQKPEFLPYEVINGDTVFLDVLDPSWSYAKRKRRNRLDWRKQYKLVYNFNKVYPYALVAREILADADSTLAANPKWSNLKKEKYLNKLQTELFNSFEEPLKHMSFSQGALLVKLIDRETGKSTYNIIREYKNSIAAFFWQGIALLFSNDLKQGYDPKGDDIYTEHLVTMWENGEFPMLYFSVFGKWPPVIEVPSYIRKSE